MWGQFLTPRRLDTPRKKRQTIFLTTSQVCYTKNCLPFGSFCHGQIQWHLQLGVEKFYFYTLVSNYIRQQRQIGNLRSSTVKILDIAITMMPVIQRRKKICTSLLYKFRCQFPTRAWQPRISSNRSMKFFCTAFPTAVIRAPTSVSLKQSSSYHTRLERICEYQNLSSQSFMCVF